MHTNTNMLARQSDLLKTIIEAYIVRAQPIGSKAMVLDYHLPVSPATIRNEMNDLEQQGFLEQPHTSAGRIPTEKAYQWYVSNALDVPSFNDEQQYVEAMMESLRWEGLSERLRAVARWLADSSQEAVVLATSPHEVYSAGLGNLFSKPECAHREVVVQLSKALDRMDEMMQELNDQVEDPFTILIGSESPFGEEFSVVATRIPTHPPGLVGVIGPMRMSYGRNIALIRMLCDQDI